ncbi:MAG TPA: UDP-N-acetylmuramoyl-L-alanyl-D-glutamate--2,6-diaminopimelate ligase [Acidimicrobiales bacterium]|nr:UDP-N-acetylmuramoyl-L-alanyl-D-glutamate--2,6-diaminopimelate ligase [Acidimicrobiales bacterium]
MTLLFDDIDVLETSGDPDAVDVTGVEHDSRRVAPGDLFCCLVGHETDGHDHVQEAVARGAVGLVVEHGIGPIRPEVARIRVAPGSGRSVMAHVAAAFYGSPAAGLVMAGVTGTNGKTTVAHLLGAVLEHAGHPTTVIGTLTGARTTPESIDLQRMFAEARDTHPREPRPAVAMEVSSHALVQARVDAVRFDVAVFTNLSHDHLDFHESMEAYFEAKAMLFDPERAVAAVVGTDDPWGQRLFERVRIPAVPVNRTGVRDVELGIGVSSFRWRGEHVIAPVTGLLNVTNVLLAAEAAVVLGIAPAVVAEGLSAARPVAGRLEAVDTGTLGFSVLVDYAHTPAALQAVLAEGRRVAAARGARTIVVFGCGGDRDASKRPLMGAIAAGSADVVVVTSDNPRHEDADDIIRQVLGGIERDDVSSQLVVEPDRRRAIHAAIERARPGDVVLVAGKGHETVQEVGDQRFPFDDRVVVAEVLASVGSGDRRGRGG